jgi:deoxyribonuclease-4
MKQLLLGAHMSIAGGVSQAFARGQSVGCVAIQIFTKNSNQWFAKPLDPDEIARFREQQAATGIAPVIAHDSYLINLGTPDETLWRKSVDAFTEELERCEQLGIPALVTHPGSHMGSGEEAGLARIAQALNEAHARTSGYKVISVLEITAGQGDHLGYRFAHLARIRDMVKEPERIGVCFDTCHALAAGYEFRTPETYQAMWEEFDRVLGLGSLRCFHFNDSKKDLGSRVDRHEHIGKGFVGLDAFRFILNDPLFRHLPMLLETPKSEDMHEDVENLRVLRSLIAPD